MKRILTIFGTRPEAIKLAPVILELNKHQNDIENIVCVTAQHREMLDQVLEWFHIRPQFDLNLMKPDQGLSGFTCRALSSISSLIDEVKPDMVLVQGDTTSVMTAALAAFYQYVPVGHIEAGLRTRNQYNPFPEEINRRITGVLASFHFAPTEKAVAALRREHVPEANIFLTGNTVVDALLITSHRQLAPDFDFTLNNHRLILVTAHRRESFGSPFETLCFALKDIVERNKDVEIVYPVHLNPNVQEPVMRILGNTPNIHLIPPLRYEHFVHLMSKAYLVLTDSGGIQEEAPVFGKPTLVMRDTTERQEAIEAGTAMLVGTDRNRIVNAVESLLSDDRNYQKMACSGSPFGDGHASERIVNILLSNL